MFEPWPECPICQRRGPEHDRMRYGDGPALFSASAMLLAEAGASQDQVESVIRGLELAH